MIMGSRAVFKVPCMSVQEFVIGSRQTIDRLSDPLAEGHLNNSPVEITLGLNAVAEPECYFRWGSQADETQRAETPKVEAETGKGFLGRGG